MTITRMCGYQCKIESVANLREHWAKKAKRVKLHRQLTQVALAPIVPLTERGNAIPCCVTLVRISPHKLDSDNLQSAFKAVRDQVAAWLTMDDNDPRITWRYHQEKGRPKEQAVKIKISARIGLK